MKSVKLVIGILSIVISIVVLFQGCAANLVDTYEHNAVQGGPPGIILAFLMLVAGITAIVTRNSKAGGIVAGLIYGAGGWIGLMGRGSIFADLEIWSWLCMAFAAVFILGSLLFIRNSSGSKINNNGSTVANTHIQMSVKVFADNVRTFKQRMEVTAIKKDGSVSKEDVRALNALNNATERYLRELEGFIGNGDGNKDVKSGRSVLPKVIVGCLVVVIVGGAVMFGMWSINGNYPEPIRKIMDQIQASSKRTIQNDATGLQSPQPSEGGFIVEGNAIDAEFLGFEDHPELGMFTVKLRVKNKTEQPIWVYMDKASINDEMMQMVMTGMPLYIDPDKRGSNGFIFYYKQTSIEKFDDVNTVSFKLKVDNQDTMKEIWTSPEVTLTK